MCSWSGRSRAGCTGPLCCSGVLVTTNRMLALVTASQMASASVASFFCRLTLGFAYAGGISRTVWPSAWS